MRVLYKDASTLSEITASTSNYYSGTVPFVVDASEDALYIGSEHPFNHVYLKVGTANTNPSSISVQYWYNSGWSDAVQVTDETNGLTQSGRLSFTPNRSNVWEMESTNYEGDQIPELSSIVIYDHYWMKITFSADLSAGTTLAWIGHKFATDNELGGEFPDLNRSNVKTSFQSGKTDWEEQIVIASQIMVADLTDAGLIKGVGNVIEPDMLKAACVQKTAEIIFRSFGGDYEPRADKCQDEYQKRLKSRFVTFDQNNNAIKDQAEIARPTKFLSR